MLEEAKAVSVCARKQRFHKLKSSRLIQTTMKGGKAYPYSSVIVFTSSASELTVAFISPKKLGIAVQRNYAKRLLRAAFQEVLRQLKLPPANIVIMARAYIFKSNFLALVKELNHIFSTAKFML